MTTISATMDIAITGLGCATSLGGVIQACAAARAGMNRIRPVDWNPLDDAPGIKGCAVHGLTDGFVGLGRLACLVESALHDLFAQGWNPKGDVQVLYSGASFDHAHKAMKIELSSEFDETEFLETTMASQQEEAAFISAIAKSQNEYLRDIEANDSWHDDQAGLVQALQRAQALLSQGTTKYCLVICADSLVDQKRLNNLSTLGLLKDKHHPLGIIPGEAAACLVLEGTTTASNTMANRPLAKIRSLSLHQGTEDDADWITGAALKSAIDTCLNQAAIGDIDFVLNDLNGEDWRAHEWATACQTSRLSSQKIHERRIPLSFGDIGAASPALGITMACRWLARESSGERNLLVASSTRSGKKSAIALTGNRNHEQ